MTWHRSRSCFSDGSFAVENVFLLESLRTQCPIP